MPSIRTANRLGAAAFMLGILLFIVTKINEMSRVFLSRPMPDLISGEHIGIIALGQAALIVGFVAFYRCYSPHVGRLGRNALRLLSGGGIVLALGHVSFMSGPGLRADAFPFDPYFLVLIGGLALLVGLLLFGFTTLRRPVLAYAQWLPLATGIAGLGFFVSGGEVVTATFLVFRTLFAIGLFGLGVNLWVGGPEERRLTVSAE